MHFHADLIRNLNVSRNPVDESGIIFQCEGLQKVYTAYSLSISIRSLDKRMGDSKLKPITKTDKMIFREFIRKSILAYC